jgi:hypothetical protein
MMKATPRQSIRHFQSMTDRDFVYWLNRAKNESNGVLRGVKAVMKIDGLGARFGKTADGRIFFEGSRTGLVFEVGAFSTYASTKQSRPEVITRAKHYDDMLGILKEAPFIHYIPLDCKVVCEIFYNPMAVISDNSITFVIVNYDRIRLGSQMTIMPYTVLETSTGNEHPDKDKILRTLYQHSTPEIKFIDPNLDFGEIDINEFIDGLNQGLNIQELKSGLAEFLLWHPSIVGKFKLGPNIERIVLHLHTCVSKRPIPYKLTTNEFKAAHRKQQ